ncbi:Multiple stress resistance protein BhsA precursor [Serratia grimesii]|jgi:multiple stress resistance protein BhsA|uniref:YdgH/BhsA/McbA-like domain-containing protein n=1 Tax=Serratia grimesii TaxID=82995 RepID=A0ABR4U6G0_9GAMM|nr:YdgH/BhsA/McbA-like domain containing protein [Serratia grimesii]KFB87605.1 hypothetical protein CR62_11565 [Serratia grimesii]CAI0714624.1 Multiple stress resistance protein BhsA precursor [Serratia grimesii]CAI0834796.1 Multiple stress resistance protein BhsA precursor [Serratia grimesii]CAI2474191.1 Multiple stress resistance protein BhsA precursor [Serratia grimesii]CUW03728.1 Multiple stress resistance protein BhsA precursor [Serratia grimesii]
MKTIKYVMAAFILAAVSTSSFAANSVNSGEGLTKIGVVSAGGALTLSSLENKLAKKADQAGASSYRIIAASGGDKLHGVAVIYQ